MLAKHQLRAIANFLHILDDTVLKHNFKYNAKTLATCIHKRPEYKKCTQEKKSYT